MDMIKLTIDNKVIEVEKGTTIYHAAKKLNIEIPILCYMNLEHLDIENKPGGCRICVVEVEGRRNLAPSCSTKADDGMVVRTNTMRVINARRTVMEFILSDHPKECLTCSKSGHCDLQDMAQKLGVREIPNETTCEMSSYRLDTSPSIIRNLDKCIMCRRCETMCNEVQTVGALSAINRGFEAAVGTAFEMNLEASTCTYCGQCVAVCPTAALTEVDHTPQVIRAIADPTKTVVVQTAPAVRAALGEEFGMEAGTLVTGQMVTALRGLGFDHIFDTDFAADLTIMEEGTELLGRLNAHLAGDKNVKLPILTSCCPGWVNFFETQFPDMKDIPSTARSPQQMFGPIAKTYFAGKLGIKREDMVVVSIMPCLAKKYEAQRDEFKVNGNPDVDFSISTRELAHLIKQANMDLNTLEKSDFDQPMGESTGAGVIFGATGGVIEAAARTAYEVHTGKTLEKVDLKQLRGMEGIRAGSVDFDGLEVKIGIAHGLGNARKLLNDIRDGKSHFHAIEIMACPGGCIGGGGQPLHHGDSEILQKRAAALYREDAGKPIRKSHENPAIKELYETFLGEPCGELSHELLHTHYFDRKRKRDIEE
ncbi:MULTISPECIES: NADH-dependent [FeFe] hydrogenase, group A6 [unclassified Lentimicrobium]|uniref:NADH-dependent [FeFe] hydrogenase, group A6 n=1 Tax=unclassified Lentimicrobium TaxID=2677434 RepID=UPI0015542DB3|nr:MULTISPECIES: NADH-dependent [FeFe] hydrogenase, group A6 [unclassified Lentimicrobium]NPD46400.1 2Fe-2S iron-sulfur cluster binding domain-containing protein [Lentimicrobium sp. S6]NPD83586.1 2Fe-2S iron-sulfur cluster binding domain-containing protein [Lentimicrobium sp. L6]